jgi:hypothetical protein
MTKRRKGFEITVYVGYNAEHHLYYGQHGQLVRAADAKLFSKRGNCVVCCRRANCYVVDCILKRG